jgi:hypothetical protein
VRGGGGIYIYADKLRMCQFSINIFMSPLDYEAFKKLVVVNVVTSSLRKAISHPLLQEASWNLQNKSRQYILITVGQYLTDYEFEWASSHIIVSANNRCKRDDKAMSILSHTDLLTIILMLLQPEGIQYYV